LGYPTVRDVMSTKVVSVDIGETAENACKIMGERHVGSVIVTMGNRPVGIFTERDLLSKIIPKNVDLRKAKVGDYMAKPLVTVKPEMGLREVARIMAQLHIRRLPVVDEADGKLIGVFTAADLSSALAKYTLSF